MRRSRTTRPSGAIPRGYRTATLANVDIGPDLRAALPAGASRIGWIDLAELRHASGLGARCLEGGQLLSSPVGRGSRSGGDQRTEGGRTPNHLDRRLAGEDPSEDRRSEGVSCADRIHHRDGRRNRLDELPIEEPV